MRIIMTNGGITIEVFSDVDMDFYKRAGYVVVEDLPVVVVELVAEEKSKTPEEKNAEAVEVVNKSKAKK